MVNTDIKLIIFFVAEDGEALCSQQKQDREPTVAQIMKTANDHISYSNLKNVGNITRIFRYDLNHILCEYAVEVGKKRKKIPGMRSDRVPEEIRMDVYNIV